MKRVFIAIIALFVGILGFVTLGNGIQRILTYSDWPHGLSNMCLGVIVTLLGFFVFFWDDAGE